MKYISLFLVIISYYSCAVIAQDSSDYELIVPALENPWGFTFLPDNSILITEKSGELIHYKDGKKTMVAGMPEVTVRGQGGLMDIELHPNFKTNNFIYFTYASSEGEEKGANTSLMRAVFKDHQLSDQKVLYKAEPNSRKGQHFGSRIAFDAANHIYFSIGDRGNRDENPQDITRDCGKIYRLNDDGTIPADNPFVNQENAKKAIFSYGHRNPQGMETNPFTGEIWTHEHGPKGGDEINIIHRGKNYGWPVISYGVNYSGTSFTDITAKEGMEQPLHYWDPSIAPSGMAFVNSDTYPKWKGNVFIGSLKFKYIANCTLKDGKVIKEEKILENIGRVRSIEQGNDGYLYAGIENLGIVKINPK
ncbi:PQQ-dependent sugar dehydrogenase [uncultured Polaribacter sp.]|uniref:PQQ-dependent sugar dehydrogenase n=1 Tax=uncultured Polaribacter sp. TaxID=174711 RepID=UPI0026124DEC|nr:PQQ-dependent sugar dehydrogenase [uncultured Polaribacter sp.]